MIDNGVSNRGTRMNYCRCQRVRLPITTLFHHSSRPFCCCCCWHVVLTVVALASCCCLVLVDGSFLRTSSLLHYSTKRAKSGPWNELSNRPLALFGDQHRSHHRDSEDNESFDSSLSSPSLPQQQQRVVTSSQKIGTALSTYTPSKTSTAQSTVIWDVYVDQSKASLDRGGSATLDAFIGLAPPTWVRVIPALLPKTKSKGPVVRCIALLPRDEKAPRLQRHSSLEVANVDSVDKVFRILTRHMRIPGIDIKACECLKWKYRGNSHLEAGRLSLAIDAYDKALAIGFAKQEGTVLLMRATAYLQRAKEHKLQLQKHVNELSEAVSDPSSLQKLYQQALLHPSLANPIFRRILSDTRYQEKQFRRIQYRHGLYQYALLHAAQDSLRATQLLPYYARAWLRAGKVLSDLWKLKESSQYYQRATELDPALEVSLKLVIAKLGRRQELLDSARAYGWSEDTLRLALDVAG